MSILFGKIIGLLGPNVVVVKQPPHQDFEWPPFNQLLVW